jgi:D-3-phosphoglycerate dehydrogenase / 2-oxoglutarate reductase
MKKMNENLNHMVLAPHHYLLFDFDSTFNQKEMLEWLAWFALVGTDRKASIFKQIEAITNSGMNIDLSFRESLEKRLALFSASRENLDQLVDFLQKHMTDSIIAHRDFIMRSSTQIYIVSGGFREAIVPVVKAFGIDESHVFANSFEFDGTDRIVGVDWTNPMSRDGGKVDVVRQLGLNGTIHMIGDGRTDFQVWEEGIAQYFFLFNENVARPKVVDVVNTAMQSYETIKIVDSFDAILDQLNEWNLLSEKSIVFTNQKAIV